MATRSRIAIQNEDGTVTSIYCHFDGYPEGVGSTLVVHYTEPEKVKELIALGDLSYLESKLVPTPGSGHSFETPERGITMAYHRDRGEDFNQEHHSSAEEFFAGDIEEYGYLFTGGEWLYMDVYRVPEPVSVAATLSGII